MRDFGKRVKARREELDLSQQEVANLCELSRTSVAKIEGGKQIPNLFTIVALARALETTVGMLVGETPQAASRVPLVNVVPYFGVECEVCGLIRLTKRDRREAERIRNAHSVPHPLPHGGGQQQDNPRGLPSRVPQALESAQPEVAALVRGSAQPEVASA